MAHKDSLQLHPSIKYRSSQLKYPLFLRKRSVKIILTAANRGMRLPVKYTSKSPLLDTLPETLEGGCCLHALPVYDDTCFGLCLLFLLTFGLWLFLWMKWQPAPVFLPVKSHGWKNLASYNPKGHKEWDTTEWLSLHTDLTQNSYNPCNFPSHKSISYFNGKGGLFMGSWMEDGHQKDQDVWNFQFHSPVLQRGRGTRKWVNN